MESNSWAPSNTITYYTYEVSTGTNTPEGDLREAFTNPPKIKKMEYIKQNTKTMPKSPKTIAYLKNLFQEVFTDEFKLHIFHNGSWEIIKPIKTSSEEYERVIKEGANFQSLLDYINRFSNKKSLSNEEFMLAKETIEKE